MANKFFGPNVSRHPETASPGGGSYTAEDRSLECLVYQHNRPVLDWELNLSGEVGGPYGLGQHIRRTMASGFLGNQSDHKFEFIAPSIGDENKFMIPACNAVVNGWDIRFEYSGTSNDGENLIDLPDPPISGVDTNVVILEVWRAFLSAGSSDNKSQSGLVLRHGNAKASDSVNLADDTMDPTYLQETSARVQIQYRYRVVPSWDLETYPEAPDNVVANTTPYLDGSGVDGSPTPHEYQRVDGDPGLWRAGNGNSASSASLGTVDGYIYAIPLCAVFRRNSSQFDKLSNLNGCGTISSGVSGRPGGLFSDQIVDGDVKDMRKFVLCNYGQELENTFQRLMQNRLDTEHEISVDGCAGTSVFFKSLIGVGNRNPDGVRTTYSDRAVTETVVCYLQLPFGSHDQADIDMSSFPTMGHGNVDLASLAPAGTSILEVRKVRIRVASTNSEVDAMDPSNGQVYVNNIDMSPSHVTLHLVEDSPLAGSLYVLAELAIGYPKGCGLDRTPTSCKEVWIPTSIASLVDPSLIQPTPDPGRQSLDNSLWSVDNLHRELSLVLKKSHATEGFYASETGDFIMIPHMLDGSPVMISDGINPDYNTTAYTAFESYTRVDLSFTVPPSHPMQTVYLPVKPFPPTSPGPNSTCEVFYESKAMQSVKVPSGTFEICLRPMAMSSSMTVATSGSASPDDLQWQSLTGTCQVPMQDGGHEWSADSSVEVQIPNSDPIASGLVKVPLKFCHMEDIQIILKNTGDTTKDADGRSFWPRSSGDVAFVGCPNLGSDTAHRAMFPMLMEVVSTDTDVVRPGSLVLAVATSFKTGFQPKVSMSQSIGDGCVAIYRTNFTCKNFNKAQVQVYPV